MDPAGTNGRRVVVYGFLALVLATGWWSVEAYPLTGWHFFSGAKTGEYHEWAVVAVVDGAESPISFADLGAGYEHTTALLDEFPRLSVEDREAICSAWSRPLEDDGVDVDGVRIYRTDIETTSDGAQEQGRSIEYTCA